MSAYDNPTFMVDDEASRRMSNSGNKRKSMNGIGSDAGGLSVSYFPQSRPSMSDDKSVCTLNIKSLDDNNGRLPFNGETKLEDAPETNEDEPGREKWGKGIEFLMSCIAMSVGLGNVWRFPFVALANGGGAFLIPYLIVLLLVGRPLYYLEMCIGQFSSRGAVKMYDFAPALRGIGAGEVLSVAILLTYYASVMTHIIWYLVKSFQAELPWGTCRPEWENCFDSSSKNIHINATIGYKSSAEYYFSHVVLKEKTNIDDGLGTPDLFLTMALLVTWIIIMLVLIKGISSSGKASYFLAIFPYVILIILLIRSLTLDGASIGIIYFFKPQWNRILDPSVWFAAVSQGFFSLAVCFGNIITYSSFNKFRHNVHRDATIVSILDTFTSILSGITIFGIVGHLAKRMGTENIHDVVQPGPGLAFISYPDAIAKFEWLPQLFSVLFFLMLFVLGIGSNIGVANCIITAIRDQFPKLKAWHATVTVSVIGFLVGLIYVTPGGQMMLGLVDYFGASTIVFALGVGEMIAISWIYGLNQICNDIEFMLNRKPTLYWRLTWGIITPGILIVVFIYALSTAERLLYKDTFEYPDSAIICGWLLAAFGILQVPIWGAVAISKQDEKTFKEKFLAAFRPMKVWGPQDAKNQAAYEEFMEQKRREEMQCNQKWTSRLKRWIFQ